MKEGGISVIVGVAFELMENMKEQILECTAADEVLLTLRSENLNKKYPKEKVEELIRKNTEDPERKIRLEELEEVDEEFRKIGKEENAYSDFMTLVKARR